MGDGQPQDVHNRILDCLTWTPDGSHKKRKSNSDPGPRGFRCILVSPLDEDRIAEDVASAFGTWVVGPRGRKFDWSFLPNWMAWRAISPQGNQYFIFQWTNPKRDTLALFAEFCEVTGRSYGLLKDDLTCAASREAFSFWDCKLVEEDVFRRRIQRLSQHIPAGRIVEFAREILAKRKMMGHRETLAEWEFLSDHETADRELQQHVEASFVEKFKDARKKLAKEFGVPAETGIEGHRDIPCNGVLEFAIWSVGRKRFYLAATHEERDVPVQLVMGRC